MLQVTEEVDVFLMVFERHMTTYEVAPSYWATHLLPSLGSQGSRMIVSLPGNQQEDFEKVKSAPLILHQIDAQAFLSTWQSLQNKPNESCSEAVDRNYDVPCVDHG